MNDPNATALSARLLDLINTGFDSETGPTTNNGGSNPAGVGRGYANSLYPDEIEFYAAAFELVNGDGFTEDFFSFPIMFKSYRESKVNNTSIEKTMAGVVITTNPTFVPFDIHMTGNFGRKFKKIDTGFLQQSSSNTNSTGGVQNQAAAGNKMPVFSTEYKTGYGCYKVLERMLIKSQKQDSNFKPYQLFFYNLALNSNYLVEVITIEPNQNRDSNNMIWDYNIHIRAVAMASSVRKNYQTSLKHITDYNNLTQQAVFQSNEIEEYKRERAQVDKSQSVVEKTLYNTLRIGAYGLANKQINAVSNLLQIAENPTDGGILTLPPGQGILIRY